MSIELTMPLVHKDITISGKVQGVYFRATAKNKADELDVKGIVANKPDGTVYAEVEGPGAEVDLFVDWCKKGPPTAEVETLKVSAGRLRGFSDFHIVR